MTSPRSELEAHLFVLSVGDSLPTVNQRLPDELPRRWNPPTDLVLQEPELPGTPVVLRFRDDRFVNANLTVTVVGDWAAFEALDTRLRTALPSVAWLRDQRPWSAAACRDELDGRGAYGPGGYISIPITGMLNGGALTGNVVAAKRSDGSQIYSIQVVWTPHA